MYQRWVILFQKELFNHSLRVSNAYLSNKFDTGGILNGLLWIRMPIIICYCINADDF